ncbi:uncharacterized protein LOC106465940 [Limulus polyphemus]|uniref:Uncharacterized protein LOC106465940 n=1 Tax=Limulus polyphemus TaxID=6850 RepID=A0ABM1T152_LIMPO|nr:uncharacterized protein LOC106465940 [Limulus polyphemus]
MLNRNQILQQATTAIDSMQEDRKYYNSQRRGSSLEDSGDYQWCVDDECDRELNISLTMDSHNTTLSPDQDSLNYDDISKHLDASLAEIDMETFQSKDITSALTLPGIFGSESSIEGHLGGENCASISASLLNDFELECSFGPHTMSEDESAEGSNNEPPFSPAKNPIHLNSISMDSLDCTCFDQNNIIVTCQANKSNYTLAFEEDGAHLSDDARLLVDTEQIKEEVSKPTLITKNRQSQKMYYRPTEQSDTPYTTWGTLKNSKQIIRPTFSAKHLRSRSKSLPSLVKQSLIVTESHFGEYGFQISPVKCVPVYELHHSCSGSLQDSKVKTNRNYVPLFKLFIKNKTSLASDTCSNSTSSSRFGSLENVIPYDTVQSDENILMTNTHNGTGHFLSKPQKLHFEKKCDNYRADLVKSPNILEFDNGKEIHAILYKRGITTTSVKHILNRHPNELNNNVMQTSVDNKFPEIDINRTSNSKKITLESNDCSSLYFEDSLLEGSLIQHTPTHSSTIQEEEQLDTDSVSGYETMRGSKDPFGSDMSIFEEGPSNFVGYKYVVRRATEETNTVHRLNNFFFGGKTEKGLINNMCATNDKNKLLEKCIELNPESNSQGTQTKTINSKDETPASYCSDETLFQALPSLSEILNNSRQSRGSRETSPASSGYGGSRQNSLERLRHNSQTFINNSKRISSPVLKRKKNVSISKNRSCGTQLPIHIRDQAIQTSLMSSSGPLQSLNVREACTDSSEDKTSEYFSPCLSSDNSRFSSSSSTTNSEKRPVVVYYPSYSLPDLSFLNIFGNKPEEKDLIDVNPNDNGPTTPVSTNENQIITEKNVDVSKSEKLPEKTFSHIRDWDSLSVLLPTKLKSVIPNSCQAKGLDHEHVDKEGIYYNCSGTINSSFTERLRYQSHQEKEFSCSGESFSSTTSSSRGSEHPYFDSTTCRQHTAEKTPPPIPKRSLSLPFENINLKKGQNDKRRRGILRKSPSVSSCNKQKNHERCGVTCRGVSCQLDLRRRNQLDQYTQSLENIPEKIPQSENEISCNKNIESPHEYATIQLQKETKLDHVNYKPVEKSGADDSGQKCPISLNDQNLSNPVTKAFLDENYKKDQIQKNSSPQSLEQDTNSKQDTKVSYSSCNNSSNTDQNDQCCSLNSITSPIHQLCDQLQQLLNSNTSLNLMAAALLATKGSPEAINCYSSSSNSNYPREKKSVTFHDLAPGAHTNNKNINEVTEKNSKFEMATEESLTGEINSEEESDSPPQEFAVSPQQGSSSTFSPLTLSSDLNTFPGPVDILTLYFKYKTDLLNNITEAVEQLLTDQTDHENQKEKVLKYLCPALYNVLANGLLSSEPGSIIFSPWTVTEACSRLGHQPQELRDLVKLIDGYDNFGGHTYKFYIFVFGLLNLGIIDWWFLHLTSSEPLLRQYYQPDALLCLLASPLATKLCEDILVRLRPLSSLPFALDLSIKSKDIEATDKNPSPIIPITFSKESKVIQKPQSEPSGYQYGVVDEEKALFLNRSKKHIHPISHTKNVSTTLYSDNKPSKASFLHNSGKKETVIRQEKLTNNEVLKTNYLHKNKQIYNNYEQDAATNLEPLLKKESDVDEAREINSSVQLYTDSAKDIFQRAVDLAFPSTPTREREARELCILAGDTHCKKKHDTDLFINHTKRENRCKKNVREKNNMFSKAGSKNKQTGEMEDYFKDLKLEWEQLISSPNSDGQNPTKTVTPTMSKGLPLQSQPIVDKLSEISGSPRLSRRTAAARKVKTSSPTSSHAETFSKKQTPIHNKNSPKQLTSKGFREPVKGSAVMKPITRTPRGPPNPTVKQVITTNNMPAISTKQKGVVSTPSSPSRKPNPRRASGNVNSSASNSSNSAKHSTPLNASGPNESKQNPVRKSLIPVQRENRASSGQQRRTTKHNAVGFSQS